MEEVTSEEAFECRFCGSGDLHVTEVFKSAIIQCGACGGSEVVGLPDYLFFKDADEE